MTSPLTLHNGETCAAGEVPLLAAAEFREEVLQAVEGGRRIAALFGRPAGGDRVRLAAVLANGAEGTLALTSADVEKSFHSLTPDCPQAHLFEREIAEQFGLVPEGHPWMKPVRFPRGGAAVTDFFRVRGEEVHEVAVGPVHAGVIEPGHFRFQCHGEEVFHLEISLGYQHRGVERAMIEGREARRIHLIETLAGDTSIGHAMAYARAMEALSGARVPARAQALRGIALELERLANHTGDLAALANDVGYLPTASYGGRIRGDFLNLTALLCGSRFGRGLVRPGGVRFDLDPTRAAELVERLDAATRDVGEAVNLLWETPSVMARFEETGSISREVCEQLGLVGPAARACGVGRDVRHEFPYGIYRFFQIPMSTWETGDVFARAHVRWLEIQRSIPFIREQVKALPEGPARADAAHPLEAGRLCVSLVEGWRGEICHVAMTDAAGRLAAYKIVDPSFHNWTGLAMALRGQQISDFPLCNKSFNLSYCGHDL
ncbi:MAG: NADH-quinone oxidoreductase subunit C [Planctomycetes bacterium]|nr:NADH-quinone oxidoreductase subunit C [Planctomycetota bacterium]